MKILRKLVSCFLIVLAGLFLLGIGFLVFLYNLIF